MLFTDTGRSVATVMLKRVILHGDNQAVHKVHVHIAQAAGACITVPMKSMNSAQNWRRITDTDEEPF